MFLTQCFICCVFVVLFFIRSVLVAIAQSIVQPSRNHRATHHASNCTAHCTSNCSTHCASYCKPVIVFFVCCMRCFLMWYFLFAVFLLRCFSGGYLATYHASKHTAYRSSSCSTNASYRNPVVVCFCLLLVVVN